MIISFAGHAHIASKNKVKEALKRWIRETISSEEAVTCYLGGYGDFDEICARVCREIKQEYSNIRLVYVTPYISLSEQAKIKELLKYGLYDESLYPPIENVPLRFAISKRNEWMMTNADLVVVYVNQQYGGAYTSLQVARRKKKKIVNICDFL